MDDLHILLAEDEAAHVEAVRRAFESSNRTTTIAVVDTLRGFRDAAAASPPDIAIMDLHLRDGRAVEVLTAPAETGTFPILLMTSHGNEQLAVEAIKSGAIDYIVKSAEAFNLLPRSVDRALREWRLLIERRQMEDKLGQSQKMEAVGRLAGGVAHDYNNMLNVIIGYTELALKRVVKDEKTSGYLLSVMDAAGRSADLTRQLLAFSRKQVVQPRILDINKIISEEMKLLNKLISEDITLTFVPDSETGPIFMDPTQVDQLLVNLVVNARDAIGAGGSITIGTANVDLDAHYCQNHRGSTPGSYIRLTVTDSGRGMDAATIERIFEPFFTTKELGKGTGLGLATVYGIVKQNNGEVHADSQPGKGTTFFIHLPRHKSVKSDRTFESSNLIPRGSETILVVEDDQSNLNIASLLLKESGYTVLASRSPLEAYNIYEQHAAAISLLLSDVIMPELNGKDLYEKVKTVNPNVRVLFMSGYTDDVITTRGVLPEGVNFIHKPFNIFQLASKVRAVLDGGNDHERRTTAVSDSRG